MIFLRISLVLYFINTSAFAASYTLTLEEKKYLEALGEITHCVAPESMPLDEIKDGKHYGIGAEYMKLFEKFIQIPMKLIETSDWQESLDYVKAGTCQIISLVAKTPQRESYLLFSTVFVELAYVIVTTQEKFFVSNLTKLSKKRLGIIKGYALVEFLKESYPDIDLVIVESRQIGLKKVRSGEIFGFLSGQETVGYSIHAGGYTDLKMNGQSDELSKLRLGIGIRKQYPALLDIFNKAIASISEQEKMRIDKSWMTIRYEIVENYQRIIQISIGATILILFLFWRQYNLHKHNTQLAQSERKVWQQAHFDFLTSLPNRRLFQKQLKRKLLGVHRYQEHFALLLIDLDEFKHVNDIQGHDQGDFLLVQAADRIKACLHDSDMIARFGGDEFVVILHGVTSPEAIESVTRKILNTLQCPFKLTEDAFISASIGITLCPADSSSSIELLKNADQAMYAAKDKGRNTYHYFTQAMQYAAIKRAALIRELHVAIEERQFEVYYQPIQNLLNGEIYKAEALIRWNHPDKGLISPFIFIPILEETRMIMQVGEWVFIESAKKAVRWRDKFHPEFQISVNTSPLQFQTQSTKNWYQIIKEIGADAQSIGIEITESMLMEGQKNISRHLIELRQQGFQISLDDFGTGYSSLSYLKKFDIDYLKIDKSFIENIASDSVDMILCDAIITMAHKLGLKVIAEGIETQLQKDLLTQAGCDFGQGYLLSKPVTANQFENMLKTVKT